MNDNDLWIRETLAKVAMAGVVEQRRHRRWGIFFKFAFLLYFIVFLWMLAVGSKNALPQQHGSIGNIALPHLAVVEVRGVIAEGQEASAANLIEGLERAFAANKARAVVLKINSPGGSPVQSAQVFRTLMNLRERDPSKKVYALISDVGASGAYYIAAGAQKIYAHPSSIVGSIGVISQGLGYQELLQKLGLESRTHTAGRNKNFLAGSRPEDPEEVAHLQSILDNMHLQFIHAVQEGRGDKVPSNPQDTLYSGLFWTGEQALPLGLVDELGDLHDLQEIYDTDNVVDYTPRPTFYDALFARMQMNVQQGLNALLGKTEQKQAMLLK